MMRWITVQKLRAGTLLAITTVLTFSGTLAPPVFAISQGDISSIFYNTPFYDPNASECLYSNGTTALTGADNAQKAFNYFVAKGLPLFQAAGIVGNLMEESGVNPNAVQSDGPGRGIAQWSVGQRWDGRDKNGNYVADSVYGFAKNRNVLDLSLQLDFIWYEITDGPFTKSLDALRASKNVDDATKAWMLEYERPDLAKAHLEDIRQPDAEQVLNDYAGGAGLAKSSGACLGGSTDFVNGFIQYKQCDDRRLGIIVPWKNLKYGTGTVCGSGCMPSSMAMIITNLTGQTVTPAETATWGWQHGTTTDQNGNLTAASNWSGVKAIADNWKLDSKEVGFGPKSIDTINAALRAGNLVIATSRSPIPFSTVGHFLVIRAVTDDGKWLLGNSMVGLGNTLQTKYDPITLTTYQVALDPNGNPHHDAWVISDPARKVTQ